MTPLCEDSPHFDSPHFDSPHFDSPEFESTSRLGKTRGNGAPRLGAIDSVIASGVFACGCVFAIVFLFSHAAGPGGDADEPLLIRVSRIEHPLVNEASRELEPVLDIAVPNIAVPNIATNSTQLDWDDSPTLQLRSDVDPEPIKVTVTSVVPRSDPPDVSVVNVLPVHDDESAVMLACAESEVTADVMRDRFANVFTVPVSESGANDSTVTNQRSVAIADHRIEQPLDPPESDSTTCQARSLLNLDDSWDDDLKPDEDKSVFAASFPQSSENAYDANDHLNQDRVWEELPPGIDLDGELSSAEDDALSDSLPDPLAASIDEAELERMMAESDGDSPMMEENSSADSASRLEASRRTEILSLDEDSQRDSLAQDDPSQNKSRYRIPWDLEVRKPMLRRTSDLVVSLDEIITTAFRNSPRIRVFADQPLVEESRISEEDAAFDWASFIETRWNDTSEPVGNTLTTGGADRFRDNQWTFNTGIRRATRSGGSFEIGQQLGHQNNNSDFFVPGNQGTSRLQVSYQQPLLRGRGRLVNQSRVILADIGFEGSRAQFVTDLQGYVFQIVNAYWELYFQRAALVQSRRSHARAAEIVEKLKARKDIDADPERIMRAESAAASRRSAVVASETSVINAQEQLLSLVYGPHFVELAHAELLPADNPAMSGLTTELPDEVSTAITNRPEIALALTELRAQMVRRKIAKNDLLPRLDMFLDTYVAGLRGDSNIGGAIEDQFSTGEPGYVVGLSFEMPWRNRAARSRNNRAMAELRQLENTFRESISQVALDVRTAYREVARLQQDYDIRQDALSKAIRELNYIETRFRLRVDRDKDGSLYLEDLLESQERLSDAELNFLRTKVDFAVSGVALRRSNGMLLREMGATN